jgi:four helix bundle protein
MTIYKKLEAWKRSMLLVMEVYELVKYFPKEEQFSLTSQTKRAAISVPANIAEGIGRNSRKDSIRFLIISRGSLYELETLLDISKMILLIREDQLQKICELIDVCLKLINGLIKHFEKELNK